jgi:Uma2 family endonuclease
MSPAPEFWHQDACAELTSQIRKFTQENELGICVPSPVDVFLNEKNAFQPDIIFIAKHNLDIIVKGKVKGSPDLVIEILSDGSKKMDTITKKVVYEKAGIKEYFIANPSTKEVISYYLKNGKYEKQISAKGKVKSKLLKKIFSF